MTLMLIYYYSYHYFYLVISKRYASILMYQYLICVSCCFPYVTNFRRPGGAPSRAGASHVRPGPAVPLAVGATQMTRTVRSW